ncbi:MAG: phosphatase PAP2 family protein [Chloroflexota bacterium]
MTRDQWREQLAAHRWWLVALIIGVLLPLWIFGTLAEEVWSHEGFAWDAAIQHWVHGYATPAHDTIMVRVSQVGGAAGMVPLCVLVVVLLAARRRVRDAVFVALAYGGAEAIAAVAKQLFHSARPHLWLSPAPAQGYGFPSGHAIGSMALLSALVILLWPTRWRWPALIVAAAAIGAVGLSRVYLGVHYPSDVLAAWTAALAWVVGLHLIMTAPAVRRSLRRPAPLQRADMAPR